MNNFSKRHGYISSETEIIVREDAPAGLRSFIIDVSEQDCDLSPSELRQIICRVLKVSPNSNNWSDYPNIDYEIRSDIGSCKWYKVYDIVEKIYAHLNKWRSFNNEINKFHKDIFQDEINECFIEMAIGWKLIDGEIQMRGEEAFENLVKSAHAELNSNQKHTTASKELHQAILDLSRRPIADTTGAIQHAMASLECVAREITGERTLTFGKIMERQKDLIPRPLDSAIEKAWGYASEFGRHLQENREPSFEEAELVVGISASVGNYLAKKYTHEASRALAP